MITGNIETAYINMFREGFEHSFQQKMSKLRGLVNVVRQSSEFDYYDRLGLADAPQEVLTRYGDSPQNEVPHERRRQGLRDWDWGKLVDKNIDIYRVAADPTNKYTEAGVAAFNRLIDDLIIEGITRDAYVGKKGDTTIEFVGTTSGDITIGEVSNENGNISTGGDYTVTAGNYEGIDVSADFRSSGTTSNITTDKLIAVRESLLSLEAMEETDVLPMLVSPAQQSALMREALNTSNVPALISKDYNAPVLKNGFVDMWLGFKFIYTNRLPKTSDIRDCYVLGPRGVQLAIAKDIDVQIYNRPDKKNIPYIFIQMGLDAMRMWGEHTVKVRCDETK